MEGNSPQVQSSQNGMHPDLDKVVLRHLRAPWLRPVAEHTQQAFDNADSQVRACGMPVWLDSGCGVGESSVRIARAHPEHCVVGVDKSAARLNKEGGGYLGAAHLPENLILVRADLVDFWPLVVQGTWPVDRHTIYYPNPWPKPGHLVRRWHGHPVFPWLSKLGGAVELRTNWEIYAREFARAWELVTGVYGRVQEWHPGTPETPFERKYCLSGHGLVRWQNLPMASLM